MKVAAYKTARATYAFVLNHRRECMRVLWLPLLLVFLIASAVLLVVAARLLGCFECSSRTVASSINILPIVLLGVFLLIALTCLAAIMCAGLWRLVLRGTPIPKPYYLSFGSDELRLIMLSGIKALLFSAWLVATAAFVVLVAWATHFGDSLSPIPILLAFVAALVALGWCGTRLSLAGPAAIDAQNLSLAISWHATAHHVLRLQRVALLLMLPITLVIFLALILLTLLLIGWWPSAASTAYPLASELARICASATWLRYLWPLALIVIYWLVMLIAALFIVARALEYREIGPPAGAPV